MKESSSKPKRRYLSRARQLAAAGNRAHVLAVATKLLAESTGEPVSLEAVAKAAGVTRLTVYNQFGSRRALLEAVFDERAREGGLDRISEAMRMADPRAALESLIEIFCEFWSSNPALGRLHAAAASDPQFAQALAERNERRRTALAVLVQRMMRQKTMEGDAVRDLTDVLFALTSYAMHELLRVQGRDAEAICAMVKTCCGSALQSAHSNKPSSAFKSVNDGSDSDATR
jgi:AcrR family transcriptional regulator